jgi:hypothetical protein
MPSAVAGGGVKEPSMADDWPDLKKVQEIERQITRLLCDLDDVDQRVIMANVAARLLWQGLGRDAALSEFLSLIKYCMAQTDARMGMLSDQPSAAVH